MLKKGSAAAKDFMAKIRAAKGKNKVIATKKAVAKKSSVKKQTRTSNKFLDKKVQAKKPGKRVSESGKTYYERRANRSDKGKLLGLINNIKYLGINDVIVKFYISAKENLIVLEKIYNNVNTSKTEKIKVKKYIAELKTHIKEIKKFL
jgi:hypothetical protein